MVQELEEGYRLEMAEYLKMEQELNAKLAILVDRLKVPEERLEKAKQILLKAKAACEQILEEIRPLRSDKTLIEGELQLLGEKKATLKHDALMARGGAGMRAGTTAFVEQMNQLAGDPAEASMKKEVAQADAAAALAELKKRMGKE